jgi:hypothetical protein
MVHVEFCRIVHGMFKGGTRLVICCIVSELVHFVGLECGIAGDAGEQGAEERVWGKGGSSNRALLPSAY